MRGVALAFLVLLLGTLAGGRAHAQSCSFSVSNMDFGSVSPVAGSGVTDTTGTLSIGCTGLSLLHLPLPVTVTLCPNLDSGSAGSNANYRLLANGTATLNYQLYQDAGRTTPWGSATFLAFGATPTVTLTSDRSGNLSATRTIYARLQPTTGASAGTYLSSFSGQSFIWGINLLSCAGVTVGTLVSPPTFTVATTVPVDCLMSTSPVAFGTKGLLTAASTAQGAIQVSCTTGAPYSLGLGNGLTGTGPTQRRMTKGAESVTYGLYKDSARTLPWGDAASGATALVTGLGTGGAQSLTVYALAPAQATPSPGDYSDTVIVTLTY